MAATSTIHRPPTPVETSDRAARPTLRPSTIHAIVQDAYSPAGVLHYGETDTSAVGDDDVPIGVPAAGLDRGTR
jgi:hypothetical protein